MPNRTFKPYTPSRRNMSVSDFADITHKGVNNPERSLIRKLSEKGGRNKHGRTTVRFRGGGHKRRYRVIDFKRNKFDIPAKVARIEYDPNRNARIALLHYADGLKSYIIAPLGVKAGDTLISGTSNETIDIKAGNSLPLAKMPLGTLVHNIELKPAGGGKMVRAAGGSAQVMARESGHVLLRMPSGEVRKVLEACRATIGSVGNQEHSNIQIGKAGKTRWLGKRPHNRGVTMNPVDHPHGGGEGKTSGGRNPVTPWGKPTRGKKTRKKRPSDKLIVSRKSKRRR